MHRSLLSYRPNFKAICSYLHKTAVHQYLLWFAIGSSFLAGTIARAEQSIDFNRDIRPILSNRCFACHGPDEATVEGGLRLDSQSRAFSAGDSGAIAIQPNSPTDSEMIRRVRSQDESERMPPAHMGTPLEPAEIDLLEKWIASGANYAKHWSFAPLMLPHSNWNSIADPQFESWNHSPIDRMLWSKLVERNWLPNVSADRRALLRRVYLDLIGLPPSVEELAAFEQDTAPDAYEQRVDHLLASPAFGEHWGRKWLDIARYADSAGYADDPLRTIWGYRDWVIHAINQGMPFDQFTLEQLAGDLLPNPTPEQLVATAFHRNTMTNNEGGTNDEEFRNVAVVDRVNTTAAAWLGMTMACAQCHTHKYDPITHEDYFRLFAIFNQSQDADRTNESPTFDWFTPDQRTLRKQLTLQLQKVDIELEAPAPQSLQQQSDWAERLRPAIIWHLPRIGEIQLESRGAATIAANQTVRVDTAPEKDYAEQDSFKVTWQVHSKEELLALQALRVESYPIDAPLHLLAAPELGETPKTPRNNFVMSNVELRYLSAASSTGSSQSTIAQFLRVEVPGDARMVSLAEVEIFAGSENIARSGIASQSSTGFDGIAARAIDGNRDGNYAANSVTHTAVSASPWWEIDLKSERSINSIAIWNRTDGNLQHRLDGAVVTLYDSKRNIVSQETLFKAATENPIALSKNQKIPLSDAKATYSQDGFPASHAIDDSSTTGWAIGGGLDASPVIEFRISTESIAERGFVFPVTLQLTLDFRSPYKKHTLREFRISTTSDARYKDRSSLPDSILKIVETAGSSRSQTEQDALHRFYTSEVSPANSELRLQKSQLQEEIQKLQPLTRVPVMRELAAADRRETFVQLRGNYREHGAKVEPGLPPVLHRYDESQTGSPLNRLDLAKWLIQPDNPLTARVIANRYWESIFGIGIVSTSEDFGLQGAMPTHPELLDFLAGELLDSAWDTKRLLRLIVTSQAYRQSSQATAEEFERDPDNAYLSRGPRVRPAAEVIRDATLAASGLLTHKMFGPPVRPVQPNLGLSAAFGGKTDWETSRGEDRYRRATYTQWRRSSPYASMATFDAPNRETCTLKRDRTNTPLQALVTLNDPNFIEAAQYLARRIVIYEHHDAPDDQRIQTAFELVLGRVPESAELAALAKLLEQSKRKLQADLAQARELATIPIGPIPTTVNANDGFVVELAAWTALCNVLLNLDEFLVKL